MADNIIVGTKLLDYTLDLQMASAQLAMAQALIADIAELLPLTYDGDAKETLTIYISSFSAHLNRMNMFYLAAAQYVYNVYDTMTCKDEALSLWLQTKM